jgi:uncharacterized Ntn-hydrolase superfamily protein
MPARPQAVMRAEPRPLRVVAKPLAESAGFGDRVIDLRVDGSRAPLVELRRLLNLTRSRQLVADGTASTPKESTGGGA